MDVEHPSRPDLDSLTAIFYARPSELARFRTVEPEAMDAVYRRLLCHEQHMTVTVESFHRSPVDVNVLSISKSQDAYSRRILLRRQSDQEVVQFGIVRLNTRVLRTEVREQIEAAQIPLGRVLIQNDVMREVELCQLFEVACGPDLAQHFGVHEHEITFGRTALIHCDGEPAVELLEIVAPNSRI